MKPVVIERQIECAADVCTLWRELTDTDRMNRMAGMRPIELTPLSDGTAARYLVKTVLGGFQVDYEELPFEWKEFESFESHRKMRSGPVLELRTRLEFAPRGEASTVTLRLTLVPRVGLLRPVVYLAATQSAGELARAIHRMDAERGVRPAGRPANLEALERAGRALEKSDGEVKDHLLAFVRDEADSKLSRIRPYELADAWGLDRTRVLSTCLEAVGAGLLDLRWDIICPSCRTASARVMKLAELPREGHCQLCELDFEMDLERAVEATFSPNPSIREIDRGPYCIGGPARTPHVYAQVVLHGGARAAIPVPTQPGRYKLFGRGGASGTVVVEEGAESEVEILAADGFVPSDVRVAPGGALVVHNQAAGDRHVKIERLAWLDAPATAHEVSLLAAFRRLFSTDILSTGTVLRIARVGLLSSDLTASTALYTRAGDASAYRLVHEHFQLLGEIVERNRGAVVKTMGDAVMAAFADELCGIDACTEMLEAFYRFRHGRELCDDVYLKLGFFVGPSYVVSANDKLDYFGQTVNIAARLQAKAESSELVTSVDVADRAKAGGKLAKLYCVEHFDASLKGLGAPLACARLRLAADVAQSVRPPADVARSIPPPRP